MSTESLTFRCRATIGSNFLSWPLVRATVSDNAITLETPEVGRFLRRLGMTTPVVIQFGDIESAAESRVGTYHFRVCGEQERRELRAGKSIDVWAFARDRRRLAAALETAGVRVARN